MRFFASANLLFARYWCGKKLKLCRARAALHEMPGFNPVSLLACAEHLHSRRDVFVAWSMVFCVWLTPTGAGDAGPARCMRYRRIWHCFEWFWGKLSFLYLGQLKAVYAGNCRKYFCSTFSSVLNSKSHEVFSYWTRCAPWKILSVDHLLRSVFFVMCLSKGRESPRWRTLLQITTYGMQERKRRNTCFDISQKVVSIFQIR